MSTLFPTIPFGQTPNAEAIRASMPPAIKKLVAEYQCPGCASGVDPKTCSKFEPDAIWAGANSGRCKAHVPGTRMSGVGRLFLGLPKGFNRQGPDFRDGDTIDIVVYDKMPTELFSIFNVPVWAAEYEGDLLIRLYMPRVNRTMILVVKGAKFSDLPTTLGDSTPVLDGDQLKANIVVPLPTINVTSILKEMD